jgi:hypothetical protein
MAQDVSFSEGADSALYLGAFTPEDVEVVSSMLQDGVFCMKDLAWTKKKRKLALLVNRFRWESNLPERVRTILIINNVLKISSQGIERTDIDTPLNLLKLDVNQIKKSIFLTLLLSEFGAIRCEIEAIEVSMKDVTRPYTAKSGKVPMHPMIYDS